MLEINTTAPAFSLPDKDEVIHTQKEFKDSWSVLYFYPKDNTSGCTKQACGIAEVYAEFTKLGVSVFGVSKDSPASHVKFTEKFNLPFTLLSDESTKMIEAYGAWQEKSMYGRKYMGTARVTYIIDPKGKIAKVYPKVSPAEHAHVLLKDLKKLMGDSI